MPLSFLQYDVFTDKPLTGNQLAVFEDGRGLSDSDMQAIAREMNFAESTFILPPEQSGTNVRMRIFTPDRELPMAGHPTIGTTFALAHTGVIRRAAPRFVFGLNIGPVPVDLQWNGGDLQFAWMTQPNPTFGEPVAARDAVASALGLTVDDLVPGLPVQEASSGVAFLFVPLRGRDSVDRAVSDASAFRRLAGLMGTALPIFLFALSPPGSAETVYSRMFAPAFGIAEDAATGGASGPLGCYLVRHGCVSGEAARQIVSLQGVAMRRPSRIHVEVTEQDGAVARVRVGGRAVLVARGELLVSGSSEV